jgi:hypothetical protein
MAGMIRMTSHDRKSAIHLLGGHGHGKLMGKSDAAEGDDLLRGVSVFLTPAIGWADRHDQLLDSSDSCLIDPPSKLLRAHHLTCRIKERKPDHPSLA